MVREYELMYIVRPELDEDGVQAAVTSVQTLIEGLGGEVYKTTQWGKRRLAYEVRNLRDGFYVIAKVRLDGSKVADVERALRIHDTIFRHLLVVDEIGVTESGDELAPPAAGEESGDEPARRAPRAQATDGDEDEDDEPVAVAAGLDEEE